MRKQGQKSGNNSTNLQIGSVQVSGIGYSEARQIAVDVMKSEISSLSETAEKIALERINFFSDKLMSKLEGRADLLPQFAEPRTQYLVKETHSIYSKYGNDEIADLSIDMLVEFIASQNEDFKSIILNDAIRTIHSLTLNQIDCLSVIFIMRHLEISSDDIDTFLKHLNELISPFIDSCTTSKAQIDYLVGIGCGNFEIVNQELGHLLNHRFKELSVMLYNQFLDEGTIKKDAFHKEWARRSQNSNQKKLTPKELEDILGGHSSGLDMLIRKWNGTWIHKINLRIVGKAIAVANIRRKIPEIHITDEFWMG